jgi:carboxyl-terminal processing protease
LATVTNSGTAPVHRLRGMLETEHTAFKGREFLFGRIEPGQTRKWAITTKIAKEAASRSDVLTLTLASSVGEVPTEASLPVVTKYIPHPQFAYTYAYDDEKRGDGDGVLEVGEGVDFMIFVTNTGPGDADDVSLRLKSAANESLFLERGRATIGAIKAGETRSGRLKFRIPASTQIAGENLPLELTIYDNGTGEWLEDQFPVVAKPAKFSKLAKKPSLGTVARDTPLWSSPDGDVLAAAKKGTKLSIDAKNGDYYRVQLVDEGFGWLKANDVKLKGVPQKPAPALVEYRPKRRPPTIELGDDLGGRVVDTESVELSGTISGRSLRDMYVLVNDKKVFFKSGPESAPVEPTAEADQLDEHNVALPFKLDLRLDEGLNKVLVVARLDEKVISYRSLFVSRRNGPSNPHATVATTDSPEIKKTDTRGK